MSSPFPAFPICQITFPSSPLINAALAYSKEHTDACTVNHTLRSAAFSLLLMRKLPPFAAVDDIDVEAVVLANILHDLGWATTKSLLSPDKRFEIDGANLARDLLKSAAGENSAGWDKHRVQLIWDAIALHTTPSIAQHKEPEVSAVSLGIFADFVGPNIPIPGNPISVDEYKEIVTAFPRLGFKDHLVEIMCGLCREKPDTTFDNFVSDFGKSFGLDGKGTGKEDFKKLCEEKSLSNMLMGGLEACEQWES
ncbi:hypothetical protein PV08_03417 [Exophiala spinifera]|uniref:HD domain-containing protein n=1 Tax=Exophiala spinifera TaxID=91928 RepID=A0A0D2BKM2_9EURO|nr:uncharacterized protein PV08_03417 [Exophiala spinifera]KIW19125.1 hypothetical protein PV08_03417 [Exophiala spinifera]